MGAETDPLPITPESDRALVATVGSDADAAPLQAIGRVDAEAVPLLLQPLLAPVADQALVAPVGGVADAAPLQALGEVGCEA